jgi:hypothetical protein
VFVDVSWKRGRSLVRSHAAREGKDCVCTVVVLVWCSVRSDV